MEKGKNSLFRPYYLHTEPDLNLSDRPKIALEEKQES